jgi:3-hydroxyisobutyrate dehydrogenase-like beta-hydroxyacid dehydrogenase
MSKHPRIGFIGFGEAAFHIGGGLRGAGIGGIAAFDINTHIPGLGEKIRRRAAETDTRLLASNAELTAETEILISTVTSDQALAAAQQTAPGLHAGLQFGFAGIEASD